MCDARSLLESFRQAAPRCLLFLKRVRAVRVYIHAASDALPRLLYEASCGPPFAGGADPRSPANDFVASCSTAAQLSALLQRTPDASLPSSVGELRVTVTGDETPQRWLVSASVGGGPARPLCTSAAGVAAGRVPLCGVAARLDAPLSDGRAFACLPLPLRTALPVHINGCFELASNRRDVWWGEEGAAAPGGGSGGSGRERSAWNDALLRGCVAPAYARLLLAARASLGATPEYFRLFPPGSPLPAGCPPWVAGLIHATLEAASALAILPSCGADDGAGNAPPLRWLVPRDALLPDPDAGAALLSALARVPGANLAAGTPPHVVRSFAASTPPGCCRLMSPPLVRGILRQADAPRASAAGTNGHRSADDAAALLEYVLCDLSDDGPAAAAQLDGTRLLPLADGGMGVLSLRRAGPDNGQQRLVFVPTADEAALLPHCDPSLRARFVDAAPLPPAVFARLVSLAASASTNLAPLDARSFAAHVLPSLLPHRWARAASAAWDAPGSGGQPSAGGLDALWRALSPFPDLSPLGEWPVLPILDADAPSEVPGEGTVGVDRVRLIPLRGADAPAAPPPALAAPAGAEARVVAALRAAGASVLSPPFVAAGFASHAGLSARVRPLTPPGALDCLPPDAGRRLRAARLPVHDVAALRSFLLRERLGAPHALSPPQAAALCSLPLFESFAQDESGAAAFVALWRDDAGAESAPPAKAPRALLRSLPPDGAPVHVSLLVAAGALKHTSDVDEASLAMLGVTKWGRAELVKATALASPLRLSPPDRRTVFLSLLSPGGEANALSADDASFAPLLRETRFLEASHGATPDGTGATRLFAPRELFDPRCAGVAQLLSGVPDCFPAPPFDSPTSLDALARLGLRRAVDVDAVLRCASAAADEARSRDEDSRATGRARGAALLSHLSAPSSADAESVIDGIALAAWEQLAAIGWCPTDDAQPHALPPPPPGAAPRPPCLLPAECRPVADAWLCSATRGLVALPGDGGSACSAAVAKLRSRLGWDAPLPADVLAAQIAALSMRDARLREAAAAEAAAGDAAQPAAVAAGAGDADAMAHAAASDVAHCTAARDSLAAWCAAVEAAAPSLYAALAHHGPAAAAAAVAASGAASPIWTGAAWGFVPAARVSLLDGDVPASLAPHFFPPPPPCAAHAAMLASLGAARSLTADHFVAALRAMAVERGGAPLDDDTDADAASVSSFSSSTRPRARLSAAVALATRAAEGLADATQPDRRRAPPPPPCYLPDARRHLAPASSLLYNDAAWLAPPAAPAPSSADGSGAAAPASPDASAPLLLLAHPSVPPSVAAALGAVSLRSVFLADAQRSDRLPCPSVAALRRSAPASPSAAVASLLSAVTEAADCCGCTALDVRLDETSFGTSMLLSPLLAPHQGPSLVVTFHGVDLSDESLLSLMSGAPRGGGDAPHAPVGRPGSHRPPRPLLCGAGLLAAFGVCDVALLLSRGRLAVFDPTGRALCSAAEAAAPASASAAPVARSFSAAGDLPRRFPDSFAPFGGSAGGSDTVLRLPLRPTASPLGPPLGVDAAKHALRGACAPGAERSLLFALSLRSICVRVTPPPPVPSAPPLPPQVLMHAHVASCDGALLHCADDAEWRRSSLLQMLGNLVAGPAAAAGTRKVGTRAIAWRCTSGDECRDVYAVSCVVGAGRARELATDRRGGHAGRLPLACCAALVARNGAPPPPPQQQAQQPQPPAEPHPPAHGGLFVFSSRLPDDPSALGALPFCVCAPFALDPAADGAFCRIASPGGGGWNSALCGSVAIAAAELVVFVSSRAPPSPTAAALHYSLWPRASLLLGHADGAAVASAVCKPLLSELATRPLLRVVRTGAPARPCDGFFLPSSGGLGDGGGGGGGAPCARAAAFLAAHVPVLDAPPWLQAELLAAGVAGLRELAPPALRRLLRSLPLPPQPLDDEGVETRVELLACCFTDVAEAPLSNPPAAASPPDAPALPASPATQQRGALPAARLVELRGVPCPTADGRLLQLGASPPLVLLPPLALRVLPPRACGRAVHPRAASAHARVFSHPEAQRALCVAPLTVASFAELLPAALLPGCPPALVAPPGGASSRASPAVAWDAVGTGGAGRNPTGEWLRNAWDLISSLAEADARRAADAPATPHSLSPAAASAALDALAPFALIPTTAATLVRCAARDAVFGGVPAVDRAAASPSPSLPQPRAAPAAGAADDESDGDESDPRPASPSAGVSASLLLRGARAAAAAAASAAAAAAGLASASTSNVEEPALWSPMPPPLQSLLSRIGAPFLDAAAAPGLARLLRCCPPLARGALTSLADEVAWRLAAAGPALRWGDAPPADRDALFAFFAASLAASPPPPQPNRPRGAQWISTPEGAAALRGLPIYKLAAGGHTRLAFEGRGGGAASPRGAAASSDAVYVTTSPSGAWPAYNARNALFPSCSISFADAQIRPKPRPSSTPPPARSPSCWSTSPATRRRCTPCWASTSCPTRRRCPASCCHASLPLMMPAGLRRWPTPPATGAACAATRASCCRCAPPRSCAPRSPTARPRPRACRSPARPTSSTGATRCCVPRWLGSTPFRRSSCAPPRRAWSCCATRGCGRRSTATPRRSRRSGRRWRLRSRRGGATRRARRATQPPPVRTTFRVALLLSHRASHQPTRPPPPPWPPPPALRSTCTALRPRGIRPLCCDLCPASPGCPRFRPARPAARTRIRPPPGFWRARRTRCCPRTGRWAGRRRRRWRLRPPCRCARASLCAPRRPGPSSRPTRAPPPPSWRRPTRRRAAAGWRGRRRRARATPRLPPRSPMPSSAGRTWPPRRKTRCAGPARRRSCRCGAPCVSSRRAAPCSLAARPSCARSRTSCRPSSRTARTCWPTWGRWCPRLGRAKLFGSSRKRPRLPAAPRSARTSCAPPPPRWRSSPPTAGRTRPPARRWRAGLYQSCAPTRVCARRAVACACAAPPCASGRPRRARASSAWRRSSIRTTRCVPRCACPACRLPLWMSWSPRRRRCNRRCFSSPAAGSRCRWSGWLRACATTASQPPPLQPPPPPAPPAAPARRPPASPARLRSSLWRRPCLSSRAPPPPPPPTLSRPPSTQRRGSPLSS